MIKISPGLNWSSSSLSSSSLSESSGSISPTGSNAKITGSIGAAFVVDYVDYVLVATVLVEIIASGAAATSLAGWVVIIGWASYKCYRDTKFL